MQEIGRGGRDGAQYQSTVFYNATDIGENRVHLQDAVRAYCKLESCRREFLLQYFGFGIETQPVSHSCCDNCLQECLCQLCIEKCNISPVAQRPLVTCSQIRNKANIMLQQYFDAENKLIKSSVLSHMSSGLSKQLALRLSENVEKFCVVSNLEEEFPNLKEKYKLNIVKILKALV